LIAIQDLAEDPDDCRSSDASSDWLGMVDRGGLFHIKDETFKWFLGIEMLVRRMFHRDNVRSVNSETRDQLITSILQDEEVSSGWSNLMEEVEGDESGVLLKMIVDLYITIRGHSFAKTLMENYKQAKKETTQKSKSLRKTISESAKKETTQKSKSLRKTISGSASQSE
jgi:hypothetical protein